MRIKIEELPELLAMTGIYILVILMISIPIGIDPLSQPILWIPIIIISFVVAVISEWYVNRTSGIEKNK